MGELAPEVLGELVRRHGAALVLYARQWCDAPEDVVQEAFLELVRQGSASEHVVAWLYRVVRNGAISASRSRTRRDRRERLAAGDESWFTGGDDALDAAEATAALRRLPLELREVVIARLWSGMTFGEIGQLTATSAATAHRRYEAAIEQLRERLDPPCTTTQPRQTAD